MGGTEVGRMAEEAHAHCCPAAHPASDEHASHTVPTRPSGQSQWVFPHPYEPSLQPGWSGDEKSSNGFVGSQLLSTSQCRWPPLVHSRSHSAGVEQFDGTVGVRIVAKDASKLAARASIASSR